jgi:hypothetical protein
MNEWADKQDDYLSVLLEFEDIGDMLSCTQCKEETTRLFSCSTCLSKIPRCKSCMLQGHTAMPFHRIALWDALLGCYRDTSLGDIGLVLELGHITDSSICFSASSACNLTVIHSNGIHNISVRFCSCPRSRSSDLQLFAHRLFPATINLPQTAFTFEVLEQFRYHHLEGKGSVYSFMNSIERLTDDYGQSKVEVSIEISLISTHSNAAGSNS